MRASSLNNWRILAAAVAGLAAASCSPEHEIDRPGTWKPTGANDANLRAMVADQRDLEAGVPARTSRGDLGSRAVTRLLNDRRRPLLNVTTSSLSQSSSGGGDSGGGDSGGSASPTGGITGGPP